MKWVDWVTIALATIIMVWLIPSVLKPTLWEEPFELPTLSGALSANTELSSYHKFLSHSCVAPESIAINEQNGEFYASLSNGRVVKIVSDNEIQDVVFFKGNYYDPVNKMIICADSVSCLSTNEYLYLHDWCHSAAIAHKLAWNESAERTCGRPLGLRFQADSMKLYILDAYFGLYVLELNELGFPNRITHLVSPKSSIHNSYNSIVDSVVGLSPKFYNDLDVTAKGRIYFSDSSHLHSRSENRMELLDGTPRGRLLRYSESTGRLTVVLCGLHFPNGVQLLHRGTEGTAHSDEVLVVEMTRFRVLRVVVSDAWDNANDMGDSADKGAASAHLRYCGEGRHSSLEQLITSSSALSIEETERLVSVSVFLDRAPGLMDNIRQITPLKNQLSPLKREGEEEQSSITCAGDDDDHHHDCAPPPAHAAAAFMIGVGALSAKPFSLIWLAYQSNLLREIVGRLVPMWLVEHLVPKYGLVLLVNAKGEITGSLHAPGGELSLVSEAQRHPHTGHILLGSHSNMFLAVVNNSQHIQNLIEHNLP